MSVGYDAAPGVKRGRVASSAGGLVLAGLIAGSAALPTLTVEAGLPAFPLAAPPRAGPDDPDEIARFTDQFMAAHMTEMHAPGTAVEVVSAGRIVLEKGYGTADRDRGTPFGPTTRFRAKSVSKAFTATAVLQLVHAGKLDLTSNVLSFIPGFTLPGGTDPPITLGELLTQTSGLGDRGIGTMVTDRSKAADLRGYLQAHMPPRIGPPGGIFLYTDHGISLAGLAVQEASGLAFSDYMRERLLSPLGMDKSAFDPPLEDQPDLAVGYQFSHDGYQRAPVGYFLVAPAVALVTTGHDMGRFLMAMVEAGDVDGRSVLDRDSVAVQEARHFAFQAGTPGVAYGLYEWPRNGERLLVHGGLGHGYSTLLVLLPERRVGLFVATNSDEPTLRWAYLRAFVDHYYPSARRSVSPRVALDLGRFAGAYRDYRYDGGQHELLKQVIDQGAITVNSDATISLSWEPGRWEPIGPLLFQNVDDPDQRFSFQTDATGAISHVLLPPDEGRLKVGFAQSLEAFIAGFAIFALLFLSAVISWLAFARRDRARMLGGVVGLLNLVFLIAAPLLFLPYAGINGTELDFGEPFRFTVVFALPLVALALAVPLAIAAAIAWRARASSRPARIHLVVIAIAEIAFPFFLAYWRLFGIGGVS